MNLEQDNSCDKPTIEELILTGRNVLLLKCDKLFSIKRLNLLCERKIIEFIWCELFTKNYAKI